MKIPLSGLTRIVSLAFLVAGCASTTKLAEWRDAEFTGGPFSNVLVIGIFKDMPVRRVFETRMVEEIGTSGARAIPSFSIMSTDEKVSRESVKAAIEGRDIDAVILTHLVGVEDKEVYYPPTYRPVPYRHYNGYYGYYSRAYDYVYEPGYYQNYKVAKLESSMYEVATERLLWTMQSQSIDPDIDTAVVEDNIEIVLNALRAQGLL